MDCKRVYIAGPFRATSHWEIEQNIRRAETVALAVDRAGGAALCPHANTRFYQGAAPDSVWLNLDLEWLDVAEALLVLPDSQDSSGTHGEIVRAREIVIPIFRVIHVSDDPKLLPGLFVKWLREPRD